MQSKKKGFLLWIWLFQKQWNQCILKCHHCQSLQTEARFFYETDWRTWLKLCPNVSTNKLRQWSFRQWLPFSWTTLRGNNCRHPIAVMGVVDTFGLNLWDTQWVTHLFRKIRPVSLHLPLWHAITFAKLFCLRNHSNIT